MSDKFLAEGEWKKFSKGRTVKDAKFLKLLSELDKAKTPEQQLAALAEIRKESDQFRKAAKGDKEFLAYVDGIDKAIAKEEKLAKEKESEKDEDEGEEETPDLLTTKMIPLIRQVKKGEQVQVLVANTGNEVAVLMSRRAISPSRRKLLSDYLGGGSAKYLPGTCIMEENAYTFILQTKAAGLAKKIKAALLKQVELRLKVRVRGEDANDVDDDGEPDEANEGLAAESGESKAGAQSAIPTPPPMPPDQLKIQFDRRWPALEARVLERLKAGTGDVSKLRAVAEFVREKGEGGNYKAAVQGMDSLEKLLPTTAPAADVKPAIDPAAAFNARLAAMMPAAKTAIAAGGDVAADVKLKISEAGVFARKKEFDRANALLDAAEKLLGSASGAPKAGTASGDPAAKDQPAPGPQSEGSGEARVAFTKSRLEWDSARKFLQSELRKLEGAILAESAEEPDFDQIQTGVAQLYEILEVFDERLIDKLDEALNAEGEVRRAKHAEAREIIAEYLDFANSEPLMQDIDASGFIDLKIRATLVTRLQSMDRQLGASFARY